MRFLEQRRAFTKLMNADDLPGIRRLLHDNPDYLADSECRAEMMLCAALSFPGPRLVALLHELGIPLDISSPRNPMDRPLASAACTGKYMTVWWLVEHGAEVNWEEPGRFPYCVPLAIVIREDHLPTVRVLVEAGARLDVCDRTGRTPLSWALASGRKEIAEYLRSRGAIESEQAVNYTPPPPPRPVLEYMRSVCVEVSEFGWQPIVPDGLRIAVHAAYDDDHRFAFTEGLSDFELATPNGKERFRHVELAVQLPDSWPTDPRQWSADEYVWVVQWLRGIAAQAATSGEWLHDPNFVLSNGNPPETLTPSTKMTGWLGLVDKSPLEGFQRDDGREVVFYTLFPLHTAERDFELRQGLAALLHKFAEADVPPWVDASRPSVV